MRLMLQSTSKTFIIFGVDELDDETIDLGDLITPEKAADFMDIKVRSVYEYRRTGRISGVKFGRAWMISKRSIQEWMRKKRDYVKNEDPN